MHFIAEEMREYMAKLGFRTVDEMVGRSDLLKRNDKVTNEHADRVDLSQILNNPFAKAGEKVTFDPKDVYDFKLGATLDEKVLLKKFGPAMDKKEKKTVKVEITNTESYRGNDSWCRDHQKIRHLSGAGYVHRTVQGCRRTELRSIYSKRTDPGT